MTDILQDQHRTIGYLISSYSTLPPASRQRSRQTGRADIGEVAPADGRLVAASQEERHSAVAPCHSGYMIAGHPIGAVHAQPAGAFKFDDRIGKNASGSVLSLRS